MNEELTRFYQYLREIYDLRSVEGLLEWDQHVYMPVKAAPRRAEQIALISELVHRRNTDPKFLSTVDSLAEKLDRLSIHDAVNVRETKRVIDRTRKLPLEHVTEKSKLASSTYAAWIEARPKNDFKTIRPYLEGLVSLLRREADIVGYAESPYDALIDLYEPGGKISVIRPLLLRVGEEVAKLLPSIVLQFKGDKELVGNFPKEQQYKLGVHISEALGYSFETGRLDTTAHPFQTSLGPRDVRITTRWDESDLFPALYGVIHEVGHALYELGFKEQFAGTPMGSAISLGIHESQSRFWENMVGRSRAFSEYLHGLLGDFFPESRNKFSPETIWRYANRVTPSLIRVEADEVTYTQHIIIRMLLEEDLIKGTLEVKDLPDAWRELYKRYLGIAPSDDKDGVLQDVHWYGGSIGYFPTYALGNLYGAMMYDRMREDLPTMDSMIKNGQFLKILEWLRVNVHEYGMRYRGDELIQKITGKPLSEDSFLRYIRGKFGA